MGLFDKLGGQQGQQQITPDMMRQEIGSIKANPGNYLSQHGFNIPDGMTDPRQITQHLLQTGQIGGGRLQQVMRMIGAPMGR
jgi:hypothetical protein